MTFGSKDGQMLAAAWIAFIAAGIFFALTTPLGEGIDEPAHFAYVQHIAQTGHPPRGHAKYLSQELSRFLGAHPVSWSLHSLHPALTSHDDFWKQSPEEQASRDAQVRELHFSGRYVEAAGESNVQYETHQPPLYYVLAAPVFAVSSKWLSFTATFLITRIFSVLLASLVVPASRLLSQGLSPIARRAVPAL